MVLFFHAVVSTSNIVVMASHGLEGLRLEDDHTDMVIRAQDCEDEEDYLNLCLVGRFLTDRPLRLQVIKDRMAGVWRTLGVVAIRELETGLVLFQFFHPVDV